MTDVSNDAEHAAFLSAARDRQRFSFIAAAVIVLVLAAFVTVMAFRPLWLAPASAQGGVKEIGMLLGLLLILANCVVMGAFVRWRRNNGARRGSTQA